MFSQENRYDALVTKQGTEFKRIYAFGTNYIEFNRAIEKELNLNRLTFGDGYLRPGDCFTCFGNPMKGIRTFPMCDDFYAQYIGYVEDTSSCKHLIFKTYNKYTNELVSDSILYIFMYISSDCILQLRGSGRTRLCINDIRNLNFSVRHSISEISESAVFKPGVQYRLF